MKPELTSFAEPELDRRKVLAGLLFAGAAGLAAWRQPRVNLDYLGQEKLEHLVPETIGPWKFVTASGLVVPPQDQLSDAIYSQMLTRVYYDGHNSPIMFLLAQSANQTGFLQIHRPETCYTASGYKISPVVPHPISFGPKIVPANEMDASSGGPTEHVVYWTRVGNRIPANWGQQRLATAEQNLKGILPDAILVRISTVNDDANAANATIDNFVRAMLQSIPPNRRSVFIV